MPNAGRDILVLKNEEKIVGVIVIEDVTKIGLKLLNTFDVSSFVYSFNHHKLPGMIKYFYISPLYLEKTRFFLQQAMQYLGYTLLYYSIKGDAMPNKILHKEMIRVKKRTLYVDICVD